VLGIAHLRFRLIFLDGTERRGSKVTLRDKDVAGQG
jgi:hypothetical protein